MQNQFQPGKPMTSIQQMLLKNRAAPSINSYLPQYAPKLPQTNNITVPGPPPPNKDIHELVSAQEKEEKDKYFIGDTKEEIISNIIDKKASVSNVRKALSKYADIIMEEDIF